MSGPPASSEGGATLRTVLAPAGAVFSSCPVICGLDIAANALVLVGDVSAVVLSVDTAAGPGYPADADDSVLTKVCDCVLAALLPRVNAVPGNTNAPGIWNPKDIVRPDPSVLDPPILPPVLSLLLLLLSVFELAAADSCACASTEFTVACVSATARWATATAAELLAVALLVAVGATDATGFVVVTAVVVGIAAAIVGVISTTAGCVVATGSTETAVDVTTGSTIAVVVVGVSLAISAANPGQEELLRGFVSQGSTP